MESQMVISVAVARFHQRLEDHVALDVVDEAR